MDSVCEKFNSIPWHDSKLIDFQLLPNQEEGGADICLNLDLLSNPQPGKQKWTSRKLLVKDCRIIQIELDLLGMQLVGGDIADAVCNASESAHERFAERLAEFDLPQPEDPLAGFVHVRLVLIPPGGEINIVAKEFQLM